MADAWTAVEDHRLRQLAPTGLGASRIAQRLGRSASGVHQHARTIGISIAYPRKSPDNPLTDDLAGEMVRERWAKLIGPMKAALRADLEGDGAKAAKDESLMQETGLRAIRLPNRAISPRRPITEV